MSFKNLTDEQVISGLKEAVSRERESLADVIEHLIEFEERKLWDATGYASTYRYCVDALKIPEQAAYRRINVARLASRFPELLAGLRDGTISLESAMLLGPSLNKDNAGSLVAEAKGKTNVEVQFMAAAIRPRPEHGESVREIPPAPSSQPENPQPPPKLQPVSDTRIRLGLTVDRAVFDGLKRIGELIWHKNPSASLEHSLEEAVAFYLLKRDPEKRSARASSAARQPPPWRSPEPSRRIPQAIKDEVWQRDEGQCAFVRPDGSRCPERKSLEYDHIVPFALGGRSNHAANIRLLCWGHNQLEAKRRFGPMTFDRRQTDAH